MIMIVHQDIGMQLEAEALHPFLQQFQEMKAISMIHVDWAPLDAPGCDVIPDTGVEDSQRTRHAGRKALFGGGVNC
jgi:hypothetical protein